MSQGNDEGVDLDLIASCLVRFIREHVDDVSLRGLPLSEDSVKGRRVKEEEDLWFLGDWSIQGSPPRFEALWSIDVAPGETVFVTVHIEKTVSGYQVLDWDVQQDIWE